jgi:lipid-A-disaccharide synthase
MSEKHVLVIAGEKSGEDHFLSFMNDIQQHSASPHFFGVGGDEMKAAQVELLYHLKEFSTWGYTEVLTKIPYYLRALKRLEQECIKRKVEVAVLVDFQEFNMLLAKRLIKHGIKIMYYVAPQAWAWKAWRAKTIAKCADHLFVLLNFEKSWFEHRGVKNVSWVAHPLFNTYLRYFSAIEQKAYPSSSTGKYKLLLLPGSRSSELKYLLAEFLETVKKLELRFELDVSLVRARHLPIELYGEAEGYVDTWYTDDQFADALMEANFCLAASGTVTLTCALFAVPTIVTYRSSLFNEFLFQTFVNYKGDVSLANLVHGERVFPELIQEQATSFLMAQELSKLIVQEEQTHRLIDRLKQTKILIRGELERPGELIGSIIKKSTVD